MSFVRVGLGFGYMRIETPLPLLPVWSCQSDLCHGRCACMAGHHILIKVSFFVVIWGHGTGICPAVLLLCVFLLVSLVLSAVPLLDTTSPKIPSPIWVSVGLTNKGLWCPHHSRSQILSDDDSGRDLVNCWQVIFPRPCESGTHIGRWWCFWRGTLLTLQ